MHKLSAMEYRYQHFRRELLSEDAAFSHGPEPREPIPDFALPTAAGGTLRKSELAGRPFVLISSSFT